MWAWRMLSGRDWKMSPPPLRHCIYLNIVWLSAGAAKSVLEGAGVFIKFSSFWKEDGVNFKLTKFS